MYSLLYEVRLLSTIQFNDTYLIYPSKRDQQQQWQIRNKRRDVEFNVRTLHWSHGPVTYTELSLRRYRVSLHEDLQRWRRWSEECRECRRGRGRPPSFTTQTAQQQQTQIPIHQHEGRRLWLHLIASFAVLSRVIYRANMTGISCRRCLNRGYISG